jgi:hypothetical protein
MKLPEYGRFVWYLYGHHVKGSKPPEPKQRITVRLPESIMQQRTQVYNTLKQRYGTRTVHSLGELDRETYCLGLNMILETAESQAVEEQRKLDEFNKHLWKNSRNRGEGGTPVKAKQGTSTLNQPQNSLFLIQSSTKTYSTNP